MVMLAIGLAWAFGFTTFSEGASVGGGSAGHWLASAITEFLVTARLEHLRLFPFLPEIQPTSSRSGLGIPKLRAGIARLLSERES